MRSEALHHLGQNREGMALPIAVWSYGAPLVQQCPVHSHPSARAVFSPPDEPSRKCMYAVFQLPPPSNKSNDQLISSTPALAARFGPVKAVAFECSHLGFLHHPQLREDRDRLQVDAEGPHDLRTKASSERTEEGVRTGGASTD